MQYISLKRLYVYMKHYKFRLEFTASSMVHPALILNLNLCSNYLLNNSKRVFLN
jgi:hypothetical protein